eukprot:gene7861-10670_t
MSSNDGNGNQKVAKIPQVFLFAISIVICGTTSAWSALQAGFWEYFIMAILMGSSFFCLCASLAEMTSVFPFSGGLYGLSRVTLGTFFGYLIGCCESISNIIMVTITVKDFGTNICDAFGFSEDYEPFTWLFFFSTMLLIQIKGGKFCWRFITGLGILILLVIVLYLISVVKVNFPKYTARVRGTNKSRTLNESVVDFMRHFASTLWLFGGIETVPLAAADTINAKRNVPQGLMAAFYTISVIVFILLFVVSSQHPGIDILSEVDFPLVYGFASIYGCTVNQAASIMIPSTYGGGFGPAFVYSRQLRSMAQSGLLPKFLTKTTKINKTPYAALLFGSFISCACLPLINQTQFFSEDEKEILMAAYIITANRQTKKKIKKKVQPSIHISNSSEVSTLTRMVSYMQIGGLFSSRKKGIAIENEERYISSSYQLENKLNKENMDEIESNNQEITESTSYEHDNNENIINKNKILNNSNNNNNNNNNKNDENAENDSFNEEIMFNSIINEIDNSNLSIKFTSLATSSKSNSILFSTELFTKSNSKEEYIENCTYQNVNIFNATAAVSSKYITMEVDEY